MMKKPFFNTNKGIRKAIFQETRNDWKLALRENKALIIWINLIITLAKLPTVVAEGLFITSTGDQIQSLMGLKVSDCGLQNQAKEVQLCECYIKLEGIVVHQKEVWYLPLLSNTLNITTKIIARFNSLGLNKQRSKTVPSLLGIYKLCKTLTPGH